MFSSDYSTASSPYSERSVSASTTSIEKQKHDTQRCAVDLRVALEQSMRVLIANMRRDYVLPVRRSNCQGNSYSYSMMRPWYNDSPKGVIV